MLFIHIFSHRCHTHSSHTYVTNIEIHILLTSERNKSYSCEYFYDGCRKHLFWIYCYFFHAISVAHPISLIVLHARRWFWHPLVAYWGFGWNIFVSAGRVGHGLKRGKWNVLNGCYSATWSESESLRITLIFILYMSQVVLITYIWYWYFPVNSTMREKAL